MLILTINSEKITLRNADKNHDILLVLNQITQTLRKIPPTEIAWEEAIMLVEDAISPLKPSLPKGELLSIVGSDELAILAFEQDENGKFIRAEILEKAFAVLAGYRLARDLPELPKNLDFYAKVLLLREWVHHMEFDKVYLT